MAYDFLHNTIKLLHSTSYFQSHICSQYNTITVKLLYMLGRAIMCICVRCDNTRASISVFLTDISLCECVNL